ncbi:MAG: hypothetical protein N2508_13175 [Anaerolineae bacterium]|nr:hypothetical protein [Anaerolineae bacterium]
MIVDTFPVFLEWWAQVRALPVQTQVERWLSYIGQWPEVRDLLIQDYLAQGLDWQEVARERVFPFLAQRLPQMVVAHQHLLELCEPVRVAAQERLGFGEEVVFFIYAGIGCGAGWATRYRDTPAVLLGLENIAEEGWTERDTLAGLLAHELGHVMLYHRRATSALPLGSGAWWELYDEGFAMECERLIVGKWHLLASGPADQESWYREHMGLLAAEFLRRAETGEDIRPFFGSWLEFRGHKYGGYFLGHALISQLRGSGMSLEDIATLADMDVLRAACCVLRERLGADREVRAGK